MSTLSLEEYANNFFFERAIDSPQKVLFGSGISRKVGEYAKSLGTHALLVSDPGIRDAGHVANIRGQIEEAAVKVTTYDQSVENPTESSIDRCVAVAKDANVDLIIGLGGGSSMDTAKGCNFIFSNGGKMEDFWGVGKATQPMLPIIAIPTTAGTGSECQSFALISNDETHAKMACGDKKALPRVTLLDPELTSSQPSVVTACTGIDALAHALESAVTNKRNKESNRHAKIAFRLLNQFLPEVFRDPQNLTARGGVLLGASHAGAAIEKSMLGAAHSMANPLTAKYGIIHGVAVGLSLPFVMEFNAADKGCAEIYADFARTSCLASDAHSEKDASFFLIERVKHLLLLSRLPVEEMISSINHKDISELSREAEKQWTAGFNPRVIKSNDFEILYHRLFDSMISLSPS